MDFEEEKKGQTTCTSPLATMFFMVEVLAARSTWIDALPSNRAAGQKDSCSRRSGPAYLESMTGRA